MPKQTKGSGFSALLKYWRGQSGMSQLDLALAAGVSSRHISFLETGRSHPSESMVLRLGATLGTPYREQNAMLQAAGLTPVFAEPDLTENMPAQLSAALELLKSHHEPYPLVVMDRIYRVVDMNLAARALLQLPNRDAQHTGKEQTLNIMLASFDPQQFHPLIDNFEELGPALLWRLQRECLERPGDDELHKLYAQIVALPTVNSSWKQADLGTPSDPTMVVRLVLGDLRLSFFTMVTTFNAPQNVTLEELRIESYFPNDAQTAELCQSMASASRA